MTIISNYIELVHMQIAEDVVEAERVVEEDLKDEIDEAAKKVKDEIPEKVKKIRNEVVEEFTGKKLVRKALCHRHMNYFMFNTTYIAN
jgi:gas vesicle protein